MAVAVRPDWDETWLGVAEVISRRSTCSRAKFGAVIVTEDNVQLASGYNGPPANWPRPTDNCYTWCPRARSGSTYLTGYDNCLTIHAEANALLRCDDPRRRGGTIYVAPGGVPCWDCAKLIANSGLTRVVYRASEIDQHRDPDRIHSFLEDCKIRVDRLP